MSGITDTQSLRYGTVDDVIGYLTVAYLADDIAAQLDLADTARTKALKRPQVQILRTSPQNVPVATPTAINFDFETIDTHAMVDLVGQPQRVTCNSGAGTGIYHVRFETHVDTTGWTKAELIIGKNSSPYTQRTFLAPFTFSAMEMETFMYLNLVTDFITASIYHDGGGTTQTNDAYLYVQKIAEG